jgi:diacylglycerol kinase family enzyme
VNLLFIVNASASSVTARTRVVIQKALSADHDVTLAETSRRGHATRLAQGAAAEGRDGVVVLGGDGTLNEAANGLAGSTCALGVLPGGSTNGFARTIGLPNDPIEATGALLHAMAAGSRRRIGLGRVNGRYFLFHVGMGFDAAVVEQVERRAGLKRYAGHPYFAWCAVTTFMRRYDRSRPRFALRAGDGLVVDDATFALCLKTNPYTFVGNRPFNVAPAADFDSGLSLVAWRRLRLTVLLRSVAEALGGSPAGALAHRQVVRADGLAAIDVTGFGPFPYQVDGDYLGDVESLALRHEPDCLDLFLP